MRSILYALLSLATIASTLAIETKAATPQKVDADDDWDEKQPDTIFNGQTVPPMIELGEHNIEQEISKGNWIVEFFSPSCPHCIHFKPTYQTAYEFYYTSKTIASKDDSDSDDGFNSFTRFYDFKFAKVDCIAFADVCSKYEIHSYPSMVYFTKGKEVQRQSGAKSMEDLSKWVEQLLEAIRPGSRKEGGPKLPAPGAKSVETGPDTKEETAKQEKKEDENKKAVSSIAQATKTAQVKIPAPAPTHNYNPQGIMQELDIDKFEQLVTKSREPWFIKFYAPWCHHCQALAPTWETLARQMKGKLNIGSVNCDVEKRLCKDVGVHAYPTMLFFRGVEHIEYDGLRGLGDLIHYADQATSLGNGVPDVDSAEFKKLEESEEVIFTYFYDHATTSEDFQALDRLTLNLVGKAKLVKTDDAELVKRYKISTFPRLIVSRDGKATQYPPITPRDMRDVKKVLAWMKTVWLPLVPELTAQNARDITDGKIVVMGILSRDRSDFKSYKKEIKSAALEWIERQETAFKLERQELRDAKQLRIEEAQDKKDEKALRVAKEIKIDMNDLQRTQVGFAWVDGAFWERWIKTTYGVDAKDGERVIINDEANHRYWDTTISGEPIRPSRSSILETIAKITADPYSIPPKSTSGAFMTFFRSFYAFFTSFSFIKLGVIIGSIVGLILLGRARRRGTIGRGDFGGLEKGGWGNGNGGGKHD